MLYNSKEPGQSVAMVYKSAATDVIMNSSV